MVTCFGFTDYVKNRMPGAEQTVTPPKVPKALKRSESTMNETKSILSSDRIVLCILLIVMGYNLAHRFFEYSWKWSVRAYFTTPHDI